MGNILSPHLESDELRVQMTSYVDPLTGNEIYQSIISSYITHKSERGPFVLLHPDLSGVISPPVIPDLSYIHIGSFEEFSSLVHGVKRTLVFGPKLCLSKYKVF